MAQEASGIQCCRVECCDTKARSVLDMPSCTLVVGLECSFTGDGGVVGSFLRGI